jgi:hypothetical protein
MPDATMPSAAMPSAAMPSQEPPGNIWLDGDAGPVVRPYAMTRGRTRPATGQFDLISLIVATRTASSVTAMGFGPEHVAITMLCRSPMSVAEIAAHLDLPLGIVRVMLGDLLDHGLITAQEPRPVAELPTDDVFEAVINGLRAL